MPLVLTEEQTMLKDAASDFLASRAPISHLRSLRDTGSEDGFSRELWSEMVEMGWSAVLVPEAHGGLGWGHTALGVLLEQCGRTLTPSPLLGTALTAVAALNRGGTPAQCADLLPGIVAGDRLLALACDESPAHCPDQATTEAEDLGNGFRLHGCKTAVLDGQAADTFIVSAWTGRGLSLFLVPASIRGLTVDAYPLLDTHRAADLRLDRVEVGSDALLGAIDSGQELLDHVLDVARVGAAAELLGIAEESFARTVDYLKERRQFGVPIGSFQALQHRAAQVYAEIELARSVVLRALHALDDDAPDRAELASLAKAKLSAVAHLAATEAIQMHGGIGMTDDFDIGFFLKRYRILETLYGDRYYHLDRYARLRGY